MKQPKNIHSLRVADKMSPNQNQNQDQVVKFAKGLPFADGEASSDNILSSNAARVPGVNRP